MNRWAWVVLALLAGGCGKSFQEADAIYKDEVAKLKALEREQDDELSQLLSSERDKISEAYSDAEKRRRDLIEEAIADIRPEAKEYAMRVAEETAGRFFDNAGMPSKVAARLCEEEFGKIVDESLNDLSQAKEPESAIVPIRELIRSLDGSAYFQPQGDSLSEFGQKLMQRHDEQMAEFWQAVENACDKSPLPPKVLSGFQREAITNSVNERFAPLIDKQRKRVEYWSGEHERAKQ